jgi:hypothetical protein
MPSVRPADAGFSPLDEDLALVPGVGSPTLLAGLVRLGTALPFAQAAAALAFFWQVQVSTSTARRQTETAGAAWVALQTQAVALLEQEAPPPPTGPPCQFLSVDGAMVPLVGGVWGEAKTLSVGTIVAGGDGRPQTTELSYFSRLTDAATFTQQALVEVQRRGVATAGRVCVPADGAEWIQSFVDHHRPDAVRILDFPHAVEYLTSAVQACFGAGTPTSSGWERTLRHWLRHGEPAAVLEALCRLPVTQARDPAAAAAARDTSVQYLAKRWAQIQYVEFAGQGYPIGSGSAESANKLVVEARLKGSGMHWAPGHVNPLLGLRTVGCSGRWDRAWPAILRLQRLAGGYRRRPRPAAAAPTAVASSEPPAVDAVAPPAAPARPARPARMVHGKPTAAHPWKRPLLRGGRDHHAHAKL